MPERKGRKRKPVRVRRDDESPRIAVQGETERTPASPARPQTEADASIPALRARYAGFIVAMLTLMIGTLTLAQGVVGDYGVADAALRIGAGAVLIVIALVVGALALVPGRIAAWLRR
jgi:hypothetical protein